MNIFEYLKMIIQNWFMSIEKKYHELFTDSPQIQDIEIEDGFHNVEITEAINAKDWTKAPNCKYTIGLTAYKRCGKDTAGQIINDYLSSKGLRVKRYAFADKLKDYVCRVFDISEDKLNEMKNNNEKIPFGEENIEMREVIIRLSEELKNTLGDQQFWAKIAIDEVIDDMSKNEIDVAVITDVRFIEEADLIKSIPSINIILRIDSDLPTCNHNEYEKDVPKISAINVFNSKKTINSMKEELIRIMDKEIQCK